MNKVQQTGFTIVELLIAMVISLTLIFACASVYSSLQNSIQISQNLSTAQESLRTAHYLMSRSIRQGQWVNISGAGSTLTVTYGSKADEYWFYGCLGERQESGASDTFHIHDKHLYCKTKDKAGVIVDQNIALDVTSLHASAVTDSAGGAKKGANITLKIKGMPSDMEDNGFTFSIAMRQRILIDSGISAAIAGGVGLSTF